MRDDLDRVIIERPRAGISGARFAARKRRRKNNDKRNWETAPSRESMGRWSYKRGEGKSFTDFLEPLYGLLRKNCGRPWDDVYSEIRSQLSPSSTTHVHVFLHLKEAVELNAIVDEKGWPWIPTRSRHFIGYEPLTRYGRRRPSDFWVHPHTGILLVAPTTTEHPRSEAYQEAIRRRYADPKAKDPVPAPQRRVIGKDVYMTINGTWFKVDMRPLPEGFDWDKPKKATKKVLDRVGTKLEWVERSYLDFGPKDVIIGNRIAASVLTWRGVADPDHMRREAMRLYGRTDQYAHSNGHQLNTKELRRLGVTNRPFEVLKDGTWRYRR